MSEVRTSAGVIDVVEQGSGDPVLFIHPFVTNHLHWRKVVAELGSRVRSITPTFPIGSHNKAMNADADLSPPGLARIAIDVLDALGIEKATIVGNDTGGAVAQIAAATYPDRVSGLVLTSCDAYDVFPPKLFGYLKVVARIPGATWLLGKSMQLPGMSQLPIAFGWLTNQRIDRDVMKSYLSPIGKDAGVRRDVVKVIKGLDTRYTLDAAAKLRTFEGRVLLAWGENDRVFPRRIAERLAREVPRAQLEIIEDARTFVPEDQPRALAELMIRFMVPAS